MLPRVTRSLSRLSHPFHQLPSFKPIVSACIQESLNNPSCSPFSCQFATSAVTVRSLIGNKQKAEYARNDPTRKLNTNLFGIDVVPNAREVLVSLLEEIVKKAKSYEERFFNATIIKNAEYMLYVISKCSTIPEIEDELNLGQIEEVIDMMEDEYDILIAYNEEFKPWEWMTSKEEKEQFALYSPGPNDYYPERIHYFDADNDLPLDEDIWAEIDEELGYEPTPKRTPEQNEELKKKSPLEKLFFKPQFPTKPPKPLSEQALYDQSLDNPRPVDFDYTHFRWNTDQMSMPPMPKDEETQKETADNQPRSSI